MVPVIGHIKQRSKLITNWPTMNQSSGSTYSSFLWFSANDINQHPGHTLISESKYITHISVFHVIIKYPPIY
jgi:hypothetical protein